MAQPSLAALYKRFMKGQDITGMEAQREADIRFLRMAMPGMQYSPLKLAQVLQKYSLNRVISHYGKKLVREVSQQPEYGADTSSMPAAWWKPWTASMR